MSYRIGILYFCRGKLRGTGATGLEPAVFGLTGRYVNQLHHAPTFRVFNFGLSPTGRPGFEPGYTAPKAAVLPLDDLPTECRGPDLNWGPFDFQSNALPTELPRHKM